MKCIGSGDSVSFLASPKRTALYLASSVPILLKLSESHLVVERSLCLDEYSLHYVFRTLSNSIFKSFSGYPSHS
jgi:hypothetical protein